MNFQTLYVDGRLFNGQEIADRDLQLADASCHGQFFDRLYGSYTVNTAGQASLVMLASWSINWLICGTLESSKA